MYAARVYLSPVGKRPHYGRRGAACYVVLSKLPIDITAPAPQGAVGFDSKGLLWLDPRTKAHAAYGKAGPGCKTNNLRRRRSACRTVDAKLAVIIPPPPPERTVGLKRGGVIKADVDSGPRIKHAHLYGRRAVYNRVVANLADSITSPPPDPYLLRIVFCRDGAVPARAGIGRGKGQNVVAVFLGCESRLRPPDPHHTTWPCDRAPAHLVLPQDYCNRTRSSYRRWVGKRKFAVSVEYKMEDVAKCYIDVLRRISEFARYPANKRLAKVTDATENVNVTLGNVFHLVLN